MRNWISQLNRFNQHLLSKFGKTCGFGFALRPPVTMDWISDGLPPRSIPEPLLKFYLEEAVSVSYYYYQNLFSEDPLDDRVTGRVNFFLPSKKSCFETADWGLTCDNPDTELGYLLRNVVGFLKMTNGDIVGLDLRSGNKNPEVVYINHEANHFEQLPPPIAGSFSEFLFEWERLCYCDIMDLVLQQGLNKSGKLDHTTEIGEFYRERLQIPADFFSK